MWDHATVRLAEDALAAEAARKARISAAHGRAKAAQQRRAKRKVSTWVAYRRMQFCTALGTCKGLQRTP